MRTLPELDQLVGIHARRCAVGRRRDWQVGATGQCLVVTVLSSVEPAYAECRTTLPPAAERADYWQYHTVRGKRCWFGPLKVGARAHVVANQQPVRATTGIEQSSNPSEMRVLHVPPPHDDPEILPKPAPPNDDPEIWPKPDGVDQRFTGRQR
jgi:hypothetical protein